MKISTDIHKMFFHLVCAGLWRCLAHHLGHPPGLSRCKLISTPGELRRQSGNANTVAQSCWVFSFAGNDACRLHMLQRLQARFMSPESFILWIRMSNSQICIRNWILANMTISRNFPARFLVDILNLKTSKRHSNHLLKASIPHCNWCIYRKIGKHLRASIRFLKSYNVDR